MSEKRHKSESANLAISQSKKAPPNLGKNLDRFFQSLDEVLLDITALEVNTMVVDSISGDKFSAWETYRSIYPISPDYLEEEGIHESLRDRYLDLRINLEQEYSLLLTNPNSDFFDPKFLNNPSAGFPKTPTRLPNPIHPKNHEDIFKAQRLLTNCRFLRCLRKMAEVKTGLDCRNQKLLSNPENQLDRGIITDTIYAQTIIQLDGDVINRYSQDLFHHPQREVLLELHRDGVMASEKQWRGLLEFIIGLLQVTLQRGSSQ
ncbi:hypothetical protein [Limnofasciculus baicalensis]|uniref:Uncharacterized protein n=1 Tax=Limnofasciculus baicalensis BBK-W-15 TaxID=2699891 RepID=A0AAE3GY69_9CYAN|nr:hypothetical protein [Limnofasciculus baicalensis]MCP2730792.1 hypothetical protein [Limnofasciculus baicalensis BBK-W-15]